MHAIHETQRRICIEGVKMKITLKQLKQVIKEEIKDSLTDLYDDDLQNDDVLSDLYTNEFQPDDDSLSDLYNDEFSNDFKPRNESSLHERDTSKLVTQFYVNLKRNNVMEACNSLFDQVKKGTLTREEFKECLDEYATFKKHGS